jgi:uncharacterized protein YueI
MAARMDLDLALKQSASHIQKKFKQLENPFKRKKEQPLTVKLLVGITI